MGSVLALSWSCWFIYPDGVKSMTYTTLDQTATPVTIANGDKITKIGTRDVELYVNGFCPVGEGQFSHRARVLHPIDIEFQKFITVDSNMIPQYDTAVILQGQSEPKKDNFWTKKKGPDAPESIENIVFDEANLLTVYGAFIVFTRDQFDGQMVAGLFTVNMVHNNVTGGNRLTGVPGTNNLVPTPLNVNNLSLKAQYEIDPDSKDSRKICGDAMFSITKDQALLADIQTAAYFEITPPDGVSLRFTVWDGGINQEHDFLYQIMLKRLQ